jgi:hypothetical protein
MVHMALDYTLALAVSISTAQVASEVHDVAAELGLFEESVTTEQIMDDGVLIRRRQWMRVLTDNPRPWDQVIVELGFTPTVRVAFRQNKSTDTVEQTDDIVRLTSGLLDRVQGDAVLHFDYEYIQLVRRNGELILNDDDVWSPEGLAAVHQPYRREHLAFSS